jgi:hypothetical protein
MNRRLPHNWSGRRGWKKNLFSVPGSRTTAVQYVVRYCTEVHWLVARTVVYLICILKHVVNSRSWFLKSSLNQLISSSDLSNNAALFMNRCSAWPNSELHFFVRLKKTDIVMAGWQ